MRDTTKIINLLLLMLGLMMIFCMISVRLGYSDLLITGEIIINLALQNTLETLFFSIQFVLAGCFILGIYSLKHILRITLPYIALHIIIQVATGYEHIILSGIVPMLYLLCVGIKLSPWKEVLKRFLILNTIIITYQLLALTIKIGYAHLGYYDLSSYQWLVCSIDMLIITSVLFAKGGAEKYDRQLMVFPREIGNEQYGNESNQDSSEYLKLKGFEKLFALTLVIAVQMIQWSIILFACKLGNVFIEGLIITTSFIAFGFIIKKRWHGGGLVACTSLGVIAFYIAAKLSINFVLSQFFAILVGLVMIYGVYRIAIHLDNIEIDIQKSLLARLKKVAEKIAKARITLDEICRLSR